MYWIHVRNFSLEWHKFFDHLPKCSFILQQMVLDQAPADLLEMMEFVRVDPVVGNWRVDVAGSVIGSITVQSVLLIQVPTDARNGNFLAPAEFPPMPDDTYTTQVENASRD